MFVCVFVCVCVCVYVCVYVYVCVCVNISTLTTIPRRATDSRKMRIWALDTRQTKISCNTQIVYLHLFSQIQTCLARVCAYAASS